MTRQGFARQRLAMPPCKLRPILRPVFGLALGGIALTLLSVGGAPTPASARGMGGFGHMGGMGNGGGMGGMSMGHSMGPTMHAPIVTAARHWHLQHQAAHWDALSRQGQCKRRRQSHPALSSSGDRPSDHRPDSGRRHAARCEYSGDAAEGPEPASPAAGAAAEAGAAAGAGGGAALATCRRRGERRFVPDEVITAFAANTTPQAIEQLARRHNLTQLETISLPLLNTTIYRWRINGRRPVGDLVGAIEDERIVASVQPNYLFTLQEDAAKVPGTSLSYADQYVLSKLDVEQAHRVATGKNVAIARDRFRGRRQKSKSGRRDREEFRRARRRRQAASARHRHGGRHRRARQDRRHRAGRAASGGARLRRRARFQGQVFGDLQEPAMGGGQRRAHREYELRRPADPTLRRLLAAAADKGLVLIAAAGNAGPNSPPLYPGADPNVIAVTATNSGDAIFAMANRGNYIAVAAPGVDILALAPGEALQLTTGTSVATAHVSGLAALLLECKPSLKPADIRAMLAGTAKPLGSGAKLVNAYRAVMSLNAEASGKDGSAEAKQ